MKNMKIQYASDLHLEFEENEDYIKQFPLEVAGDILVLAGDTCYLGKGVEHQRETFFKWCSDNYRETYLLPGNHEYYGKCPLDETLDGWQMDIYTNVHYLNNKSVVIGNAELFFTTLWTCLEPQEIYDVQRVMNDFRKIRLSDNSFRATAQNRIHQICRQWLVEALKESRAETRIVVTHHCPVADAGVKSYVGAMAYPAYAEDMSPLMKELVPDYWIHGHVHTRCTSGKMMAGTAILSNTLGYVDDEENIGFNKKAVIDTLDRSRRETSFFWPAT